MSLIFSVTIDGEVKLLLVTFRLEGNVLSLSGGTEGFGSL